MLHDTRRPDSGFHPCHKQKLTLFLWKINFDLPALCPRALQIGKQKATLLLWHID